MDPSTGPAQQGAPATDGPTHGPPKPRTQAGGSKADLRTVLGELQGLWDALEGQAEGLRAAEVAELLGRSRSVAYERLGQLRALLGDGALRAQDGRHRLVQVGAVPFRLQEREAQALGLAVKLLRHLQLPEAGAWARLTHKLQRAWPPRADGPQGQAEAHAWVAFAEPHPTDPHLAPQREALLGQLLAQARQGAAIRVAYGQAHEGDAALLKGRALGLVHHHGWQLLLWLPGHGVRAMAVERLGWPEETVGVPPLPAALANFNLEQHLAKAWRLEAGDGPLQEVVVRLPESEALLRRHGSQELLDPTGPWRRVRFWVGEPLEMLPWLLAWGAEVLLPESLKTSLERRLQQQLERQLST